MEFDEKPAVSSGQPTMNAFADEEEVETFEGLSVDQLLAHGSWKARKQGLEAVIQDPAANRSAFYSSLPRLGKEGHAAVQEQLFETCIVLIENESSSATEEHHIKEIANHMLKLTIDKGITGRPKSSQTSMSLLSVLTRHRMHEEVNDALVASLTHKTPKNRQYSLMACAMILREYGFQSMQPNIILKAVTPLFNDANALVRKEVQNVFCQCYRYLGAKIQNYFGDLRDVQVDDLKKQFEELEVGVRPEKTILGMEPLATSRAAPKALTVSNLEATEMDDETFASLDESPVVSKLPKNFFHLVLDKSSKWADRCAVVREHLVPLLAPRRYRAGDDYHELVKCLRELFVDPQAPLMLIAIQCLQSLFRGLRQSMTSYIRPLLAPVFEKFKDKKTSVLEHAMQLLNTMLVNKCCTFDTMFEEIDAAATSKVPNQRLAVVQWLTTVLNDIEPTQGQRFLRAHGLFTKLANDEKLEVRDASTQLMAKMISVYGEKPMQPILSSLEPKQLAKVLGSGANSNDQSMMGRLASSILLQSGDSPSVKSPMKKVARIEKSTTSGTGGLVTALSANNLTATHRKLASSTSVPSGARSVPVSSAAAPSVKEHDDPASLESSMPNKDEASQKVFAALCNDGNQLIPGNTFEQLNAKEWKTRFDAVTCMAQAIRAHWEPTTCTDLLDHVVVLLKSTSVWKDSIFQVANSVAALLIDCATRATVITHRCAFVLIQAFSSRLTEPKSKGPTRELLSIVAEGATPKFVMKHIMQVVQTTKSPKLTQEVNEWFAVLIAEFEGTPMDAKAIVDYVKQYCFEQTQPVVKQSAVTLMVALRQRVGAKLDAFLVDINPHLRATLDAEFAKPPPPAMQNEETVRRQLKASASGPPSAPKPSLNNGRPGSSATARSAAVAEDDLSRVDLGQHFVSASRDITTGKDWKARSVSMKKVEDMLIASHKLVAATGVTELLKALRTRFDETNKNLVVDALRVIGLLLESTEPHASKAGLKHILPGVLSLLSDQKANLREEAAKVGHIGVTILGLEHALPMLMKPLSSEALLSRQIAVEILDKQLHAKSSAAVAEDDAPTPSFRGDMSRSVALPFVPVLLKLAMDRSSDVRAAADRITAAILPIVGPDAFTKPLQDLKPAEQQQVRPMLERRLSVLDPQPPPTPSSSTIVTSLHPAAHAHASHSALPNALGSSPMPFVRSEAAPLVSSNPVTPASTPIPPLAGFPRVASSVSTQPHPLAGLGSSRTNSGVPSARPSEVEVQPFTVQETLQGLRVVPSQLAFRMCTDFLKRFRKGEDCGTADMMQAMVDRLHDNVAHLDADLAIALINCLSAMFTSPRAALRCDTASLVPILRTIFACLLSEQFSQGDTVIRSLNSMTLNLLEGCQVNEVFATLMALMAEYSTTYLETNSKIDHKYVQVVVKCLMRLDTEQVSPDVVIISCHDYLLQHPPSAFKSRDDLSIRTIKTILQTVSKKHGRDLLATADRLVGIQNLVSHFIRACLENKEKAQRARLEAEKQAAASTSTENHSISVAAVAHNVMTHPTTPPPPAVAPIIHKDPVVQHKLPAAPPVVASMQYHMASSQPFLTTTADTSSNATPPTLTNVVPNIHASLMTTSSSNATEDAKSVAAVFAKIRNHMTSQQGIDELYAYLKVSHGCSEFVLQFNKCSDAFRSFIKRRLEKAATEDAAKPASFKFPDVVLHTP